MFKGTAPPILSSFSSATFYDLKITTYAIICTGNTNILRMKIVFLAKQYGCSTASFKIRLLKVRYLQDEKVSGAQIFECKNW